MPNAPVAGIVAALRPEKNHELFLQVGRVGPHRNCRRPGSWWSATVPQRAKLEALAENLDIAQAVHFLGTRTDVPELLSLIDVLVLTSHMEANPICLLEAMASEKPVVATRVGSVAETVLDGRTGYLVSPGDSQALADRVLELLTDRSAGGRHGPRRPRTRHRPLVGRSHGAGYEEL